MEALDEMTAETFSGNDKALFWLYAYITAAFRVGHLFVEINDTIFPSPKELFEEEVPLELIQSAFLQFETNEYVVKSGNRLFLRRAYECKKGIEKELDRLLQKDGAPHRIDEKYQDLLSKEQLQGVSDAFSHSLFCIAGGPGTGKTHTAGLFLKMYLEATPAPLLRVALLGPTGKAAANLERSIVRAVGHLPLVETKTLHALLRGKKETLNYHIMIVDESSMIAAELLQEFLERVGPHTKVLFLGDPDQLPAVEAGESFLTLLEKVPHARLTKSQRTDETSILTLASLVNEGRADEALALLKAGHINVAFRDAAPEETLPEMAILSPKKSGVWGVDAVNRQKLSKNPTTFPILITKNDYALDLMNGEIGELENDVATFQERKIPAVLLSHYEPAFALSVHKSQGSEFQDVLLLLPPGSEVFGRRMLYTAITRAKKSITIWGSEATLRATIANSGKRLY